MTTSLLNAADSLERQNAKLLKMTTALMRRVEQATDESGAAYAHFQRALVLEDQVRLLLGVDAPGSAQRFDQGVGGHT